MMFFCHKKHQITIMLTQNLVIQNKRTKEEVCLDYSLIAFVENKILIIKNLRINFIKITPPNCVRNLSSPFWGGKQLSLPVEGEEVERM